MGWPGYQDSGGRHGCGRSGGAGDKIAGGTEAELLEAAVQLIFAVDHGAVEEDCGRQLIVPLCSGWIDRCQIPEDVVAAAAVFFRLRVAGVR